MGRRCIVLETGFTKLYRDFFHKSAGLGRYLSNIAFWLARGSRGVQYQLLTPGRERVETITKGESSKGFQFTVDRPAAVTCILQWDGRATLGLTVRSPDGSVARREESSRSPLRASAVATTPGTWVAHVEGIDVGAERVPYVVTLSLEHAGGNAGPPIVMPFYLLVDVSAAAEGSIADLNAAVRYIQRDLVKDPLVDGRVAMSVIAFNDRARTLVPLGAPSKMTAPALVAGGGRSYGAALRGYHRAFEQDRARLEKAGVKIFRPCVLLLTQGEPDDADCAATLRSLVGYDPGTKAGNRAYPNVVPIGLNGTSRRTLAALAYPDFGDAGRRGRWFLAEPAESSRRTLRSVADAICRSVRETQASASGGAPVFVPPPAIAGAVSGIAGS